MRNVITLSDVPKDIHDWLRMEAARRTRLTGKRTPIYRVVVQAVREYKKRLDASPRGRGRTLVPMELFRKKLQPAEYTRGCTCVPKDKQFYFGVVGNVIAMKDAIDGATVRVGVGSQYRLGMEKWYARHPEVKVGDEIVFEQLDGTIRIRAVAV